MSAFQWKHLGGSAAAHVAILLALVVAPGFLSKSRLDLRDAPPLELIPAHLLDGAPGDGTPAPAPRNEPPAAPPAAAPEPVRTPPVRQPEPPKPAPRPAPTPAVVPKAAPKTVPEPRATPVKTPEPPKKQTPEPQKLQIDFTRKTAVDTTAQAKAREAAAKAQAAAERAAAEKRQREWEARVGGVTKNLAGRLAGTTTIQPVGAGGGGAGFANYAQYVKKVYSDAWIEPDGVADRQATVRVQVTIRRDGSVDRAGTRVLSRSGVPALDRSVQSALERVTFVRPFPDSLKDDSLTFTISFNLDSKRLDG